MRHKKIDKRQVDKDLTYGNALVTKFINRIMRDGKKSPAEKSFYGAMDIIKEKGHDPLVLFETALQNVGPRVEVKSRRVGGANYQVPLEVRGDRKNALAIRWIVEAARARANTEFHTFAEKLAQELLEASKNEGAAVKKRDTVHRMAEANRAFSHFRF
ncbi:MAG: 30S ribosomal protein S7 [Candidatus Sungbacteria bacterium RIFCSPHIGHO2_02_FULL_41_12b]|nr:MAG: 30S ribosomal protein S7 [Candidatus Levybacteria bacterium RIFCSPHIGHO2_01_FULL_36_15b]OGH35007.1 MAG: 30S ribosomal protein S7 [Candidatus Levybacteria bacterium RIFCSPLOWO2_01_FULL_36_13]OGZ97311.1 MAG: 30S ribosomal protein S7 [Candidatus Sungbacteria bacterium RIFCSPHIGHO2_02_FULL_41_12b]